ncbi:MAG: hypothetical protein ACOX7C_08790 [Brevefilum sp.]|jgi:hypothetical protein
MRSVLLGKYSQRARWALHGLGHVLKMEWGEKKHQILVGGISDDLKKGLFRLSGDDKGLLFVSGIEKGICYCV